MVQVGLRARLGDPGELLFTGAHAEVGLVDYTSPIYSIAGGYLQVSPLAFLVLRAEFTGTTMWSLGMDGAGYFPMNGYEADLGADNLRGDMGQAASGWNVAISAILQGAVDIGAARLLMWVQLGAEHVSLGSAPYHYSPRHDAILAQQEWTLSAQSLLLFEHPIENALKLRIGVYDHALFVPRSDYLANQIGPIAALLIERPAPGIDEIMPLVRVGTYSDHPTRAGAWTLLAAVFVRYDLGAIR